ncbi:uncharacterized protein LOC117792443 [Drosophila innubila]|uniref:uncharacterized protein LOC117792443 n=1 Tax=Drosophila innubila TaxID=198719 RepID=UPI00148E0C1C|nr:uncharacterized protein LOC117792443 [Drosophila innubila]
MRHLVVVMLLMALTAVAAKLQLEENYGTAGSEDIYLQPDSIEEQFDEYGYADENEDEDDGQQDQDQESEQQELGDNLDAIGEDESSCEYSCPRYYRPVCVSRNGQLITFATPCEYHNQLRCANVAKRQHGQDAPIFQLMYNNACRV